MDLTQVSTNSTFYYHFSYFVQCICMAYCPIIPWIMDRNIKKNKNNVSFVTPQSSGDKESLSKGLYLSISNSYILCLNSLKSCSKCWLVQQLAHVHITTKINTHAYTPQFIFRYFQVISNTISEELSVKGGSALGVFHREHHCEKFV